MKISYLLILIGFASSTALALPPALNQKLDRQWQQYDKARQTLLENVRNPQLSAEQKILSRSQWEQELTLTGADAITKVDVKVLMRDQAQRAHKSKLRSERLSVIDLNQIRSAHSAREFCEKIPKGGMLHIHPFGTLDRATANSLLKQLDPVLDVNATISDIESTGGNSTLEPSEKSWLLNILGDKPKYSSLSQENQSTFSQFLFLPPGKQSFPRFNSVFAFLDFAIPDWQAYDQVLMNFARKAASQGVSYVEFTTGTSDNFFLHIQSLEEQTGLTIRVNHAFDRTESISALDEQWKMLMARPENKYLVGIDFLDNEDGNPALERGQLLYGSALEASQSGSSKLHRTMHAGEIGDIRNPRDAMILGAERLGHGVNLAKDPIATEYAALNHIPVEVNLSSNLRLTDVASLAVHPFLFYLRLGIPVSLSTDDEGIFDTDINQECRLAIEQTDISYQELKEMAFNSIRTSFADSETKKTLLKNLEISFEKFESEQRIQNLQKAL